jgi:hypothetical protein
MTYRVEIVTFPRLRVQDGSVAVPVKQKSSHSNSCIDRTACNQNMHRDGAFRTSMSTMWAFVGGDRRSDHRRDDHIFQRRITLSLTIIINSDSPSLDNDSSQGVSALAFFASFLGRGFQDFNADDFVGELTTSTISLNIYFLRELLL